MSDGEVTIAEADLQELYNLLAGGLEAYAAGDANTLAANSRQAKERVLELSQEGSDGE